MILNIQEHELFHQYTPGEESELYQAMMAELQVRAQCSSAWQVLQERTNELRSLMYQLKNFDSETAVEEVSLVQARAEGLRWLIERIEHEIRELEQVHDLKARKVLALVGQAEEGNGRHKAVQAGDRTIYLSEEQAERVVTP